jgi:serpin B
MKRKEWIKAVACICVLAFVVSCVNGCGATRIQANDLMDGVKAQTVEEKAPDEAFRLAQLNLASELFRRTIEKTGDSKANTLISPLSIQLALAMTANGADGATREEMERVLGGDISLEDLNTYLYTYVKHLPSDKNYKLEIANSIWYRDTEGLAVKEDFLQTNKTYYGAQAYQRAFDDVTASEMNKWVQLHTDKMIKKIVEQIDPDMMLYLINAVVFDAKWQEKYSSKDVIDSKFYQLDGTAQEVKLMGSEESVYLQNDKAIGFMKPYKDRKYSFVALLPREEGETAFYDFVQNLTGEGLQGLLDNKKYGEVECELPKFTYEYQINLNQILQDMGMSTAFGSGADFSKMADCAEGNLYIADVVHKTYIEVDENGTKAAAITGVGMTTESVVEKYYVRLDRPFVYMIVDNETELPIFIGTLMDVSQK